VAKARRQGWIEKLPSGSFRARLYMRSGKEWKETHTSRAAAEAALEKARNRKNSGRGVPSGESLTSFFRRWLDIVESGLAERTHSGYRQYFNRYAREMIGALPLDRLTALDIMGVYAHMQKNLGVSAKTCRQMHAILRKALGDATEWGLIDTNPAASARAPKVRQSGAVVANVLSAHQVRELMRAVNGTRFEALWILLLHTGLRIGEGLALKWSAVDFSRGTVTVRRTLNQKTGQIEEFPKSTTSYRTVSIQTAVCDALRHHRKGQVAARLKADPNEYVDHDLVFASRRGTPMGYNNVLKRHWYPILEEVGMWRDPTPEEIRAAHQAGKKARGTPLLRPHDLRHTIGTLLIADGESPKTVSEMLGHSDVAFTLRAYTHPDEKQLRGAAERAERMFGG